MDCIQHVFYLSSAEKDFVNFVGLDSDLATFGSIRVGLTRFGSNGFGLFSL